MKSIFNLENRLDIKKEFSKLVNVLHYDKYAAEVYMGSYYSNMTFLSTVNEKVFLKWKYRDTFLDVDEYLEHIGISQIVLRNSALINEETFLFYIEFILNMSNLICDEHAIELKPLCIAAIQNIEIILEKMNYKCKSIEDRIMLTKRDADVDSVLEYVPKNISEYLLEYNDFRIQNDIETKRKILKDIDLYIEENINIKSFDSNLDGSIGTVVNEMGVNHPINKEPYLSYDDSQLIEWYDKCFLMMIHAIRTVEVNKIKNERKELVQK